MKIPSTLLGNSGEVRRRVRKIARTLIAMPTFTGYELGPLVDTRDVPGLVLLGEGVDAFSERNFHAYALSEELIAVMPNSADVKATMREWLCASLDVEWRFVCTLGGESVRGLAGGDTEVARAYLKAAAAFWPTISAERARFAAAGYGGDILSGWHTLSAAIERLGISMRQRMASPNQEPSYWLEIVNRNERIV